MKLITDTKYSNKFLITNLLINNTYNSIHLIHLLNNTDGDMKIYSSKYFPKALPEGKMIVPKEQLFISPSLSIKL